MAARFEHPSYLGKLRRDEELLAAAHAQGEPAARHRPDLRYADRACCCPAPPAVIVVVPASADRPLPTELLLCGHHYRLAQEALAERGDTVLDLDGFPLTDGTWPG